MTKRLISTNSPFERLGGYSRAVVQGPWIFVSGTTGYDYATMTMPEDLIEQVHNCVRTIAATLKDAGGSLDDIVRINTIITDQAGAERVLQILGQYFGTIRPAATLIVAGLLKPEMKVEIEVTALRSEHPSGW
jgi:enamine deaminase RidA (YjgF/YER057c/UK114 family)